MPSPIPISISQRASTTPPISPPARLHLRNILTATSEEPPIMPRTPRAWVWQCHQCYSVYRLGCTRRCLDCSHTYCVVSSKQQQLRGRKRRHQQTALCGAEFDYIGWEQWGSWKRKVLGYEATGRCDSTTRDCAFLAKRHNCWIDCDSPSECGHRRYELAAEMLRKRMFASDEARTETEAEIQSPAIVADTAPKSPDDDIPLTKALVMSEAVSEEPQKSPLQSSFLLDDDENQENEVEKMREQEREEEEVWWAALSSAEQVHDDDEDDDGGVKLLAVRNLTANDANEYSDSVSESSESEWSSISSLTDDSCWETGTPSKTV